MPIHNIELSQKQGSLFFDKLSNELNPKHKLYKLKELINWSDLENQVTKLVNVEQLGRERKSLRVGPVLRTSPFAATRVQARKPKIFTETVQ